jgi:hypothetical protein
VVSWKGASSSEFLGEKVGQKLSAGVRQRWRWTFVEVWKRRLPLSGNENIERVAVPSRFTVLSILQFCSDFSFGGNGRPGLDVQLASIRPSPGELLVWRWPAARLWLTP